IVYIGVRTCTTSWVGVLDLVSGSWTQCGVLKVLLSHPILLREGVYLVAVRHNYTDNVYSLGKRAVANDLRGGLSTGPWYVMTIDTERLQSSGRLLTPEMLGFE
ncbi:hypothetical protein KIPB_014916, partial [Kipferlia bialata]